VTSPMLYRILVNIMHVGRELGQAEFDYRYDSPITLNLQSNQIVIMFHRDARSWIQVNDSAAQFFDHNSADGGEVRFYVGNDLWLLQYKEL
jgi:hypothetical protein